MAKNFYIYRIEDSSKKGPFQTQKIKNLLFGRKKCDCENLHTSYRDWCGKLLPYKPYEPRLTLEQRELKCGFRTKKQLNRVFGKYINKFYEKGFEIKRFKISQTDRHILGPESQIAFLRDSIEPQKIYKKDEWLGS